MSLEEDDTGLPEVPDAVKLTEPGSDGHLFEGVEKKLVLDFDGDGSMRDVKREVVNTMFQNACCMALSKVSNDDMDAYVLSESSCFIYEKRVVLKTCGTTEPIGAVPCLLAAAKRQGLEVKSGMYCHMDLQWPRRQSPIYREFVTERDLLQCYFVNAESCKLTSGDNPAWNIYTHDTPIIPTFEVIMYDLDRETMDQFYEKNGGNGEAVTTSSGTISLAPDAKWDTFLFNPCGYSANAIEGESYLTIHITPEEACSYASVEISPPPKSISGMVNQIVELYKPGRFAVILSGPDKMEGPTVIPGHDYTTSDVLCQEVTPGYNVWIAHFEENELFYDQGPMPERADKVMEKRKQDFAEDHSAMGLPKEKELEMVDEDKHGMKERVIVEDNESEYSSSYEAENNTGTGSTMYEPRHKPSFELAQTNQVVG